MSPLTRRLVRGSNVVKHQSSVPEPEASVRGRHLIARGQLQVAVGSRTHGDGPGADFDALGRVRRIKQCEADRRRLGPQSTPSG